MRILISAGGTGGGVYPALAVVDALGERADVLWVGALGGMEEELVRRQGLAFEAIPAAGLHGVGLPALPGNIWRLAQGTLRVRRLIASFDPQALFFTGGYVGVPAALAGLRKPKVTFVPDIEPALSQRLIGHLADRICVPAEEAKRYYRSLDSVRVTGYPSRFESYQRTSADARDRLGLGEETPVLLVMGGSRGARSINQALWQNLEVLLPLAQIIHVIGERDWPHFEAGFGAPKGEWGQRYHPYSYLHEEMGDALKAADLVLSRAGASTLGEYPLFGLPSVLVPYPHAWRYQQVNATYLVSHGAARILADDKLASELVPNLEQLLTEPAELQSMAKAASALAAHGAADRIADELVSVANRGDAR